MRDVILGRTSPHDLTQDSSRRSLRAFAVSSWGALILRWKVAFGFSNHIPGATDSSSPTYGSGSVREGGVEVTSTRIPRFFNICRCSVVGLRASGLPLAAFA